MRVCSDICGSPSTCPPPLSCISPSVPQWAILNALFSFFQISSVSWNWKCKDARPWKEMVTRVRDSLRHVKGSREAAKSLAWKHLCVYIYTHYASITLFPACFVNKCHLPVCILASASTSTSK